MITVTQENLSELLNDRDFRDKLNALPHPVESMQENGFTYLDYVLFKYKQVFDKNKPFPKYLVKEINEVLETKQVKVFSSNNVSCLHF